MGYIEKTEYYTECPHCGAPRGASGDVCEFCGSSLIKGKEIVDTSGGDPYDVYLAQDAGLPVVTGKLCGTKGNGFWVIFGGMFFLLPTVMFIAFLNSGMTEAWIVLFFLPFWAVGIGTLSIPIRSAFYKKKCEGECELHGTVRGYESGDVLINDRPVQNLRVRVSRNGREELLLLKTGQTSRTHAVGSSITLKNYKDRYLIVT